jgi:hypothetical protein
LLTYGSFRCNIELFPQHALDPMEGNVTPLTSLWLPILLSAIAVFIVSSIIHMVLKYHANDFGPLPSEDAARDVLRVPAGHYVMPHAGSMQAMKDPAFVKRMEEGPVAFVTVRYPGGVGMGRQLGLWFAYCLVVSIVAAYIAGRALPPGGTEYLAVFRFVGAAAFAGYVLAGWQEVIWYGRSTSVAVKNTIDGLVFALVTAGMFGWLWPS